MRFLRLSYNFCNMILIAVIVNEALLVDEPNVGVFTFAAMMLALLRMPIAASKPRLESAEKSDLAEAYEKFLGEDRRDYDAYEADVWSIIKWHDTPPHKRNRLRRKPLEGQVVPMTKAEIEHRQMQKAIESLAEGKVITFPQGFDLEFLGGDDHDIIIK